MRLPETRAYHAARALHDIACARSASKLSLHVETVHVSASRQVLMDGLIEPSTIATPELPEANETYAHQSVQRSATRKG